MSAISFLAGMGAGYIKAKDKALENERQAARDKREQDTFDMKKTEFDQGQADKTELRQAAAPVTVTPEQGPPTEAQHVQAKLEDRQPDSIGYRVGNGRNAQMFAERGVADTEASKQNTVDGTRTRTAAVMAAQGNVLGADQLRTSGIQASAAELALKEGQQAAADKALKKRIDGFKTPEEMAAFMTESPADKAGGEFKAQARYAADRKTFTFDKVNPDGTFTPTGQVFENSAQGMDKARMTLAGFMTPEQRIQQYQFEETKAEQARHNKATEDTAKQNADANEQYRKDLIAERRAMTAARIAAGGAGNGEGAAEAAAFNPLSGFDGKKAQAVAFEQAAAATNTDGKPLSPQAQGQLAQKIYRSMEDSFSSENTARERARVFKGAARTASTPDEINAVRERAKKSGYTDAEMALLDPRFKSVAAPKVPATKAQATNVVPAGATTQSVTAPPKYSYQAQMAEAEKTRLAKQAALREAEANEIAQEKLIEEKRKAFLASRGTDTGRANLSNTTVNLLR